MAPPKRGSVRRLRDILSGPSAVSFSRSEIKAIRGPDVLPLPWERAGVRVSYGSLWLRGYVALFEIDSTCTVSIVAVRHLGSRMFPPLGSRTFSLSLRRGWVMARKLMLPTP